MTTPISPDDQLVADMAAIKEAERRAHNPDHMNGESIDKLVAYIEALEAVVTAARRFCGNWSTDNNAGLEAAIRVLDAGEGVR